ncbi:MAG: VOC family protein [Chloroflexota bacterium]|nr:VOC family protein [Chloroflexota bacterium]
MAQIQKITPFLWYDGRAMEAAEFYVSIFENARIVDARKLGGGPAESASIVSFELDGQRFTALDGGPMFQFSAAISFVVNCDTQDEVDHFWERLGEGGEHDMCGWLRDKFGVSWQIVPSAVPELLGDPDKSGAVMEALLGMQKIDIQTLRDAHDSE